MVGSMMLLKMLHCRRESKAHRKPNENRMKRYNNIFFGDGTSSQDGEGTPSHDGEVIEITIKRETSDETCRICLKEGNLPIFGESATKELCESLYIIGGIKVCADDPYPKSLCQSCHALLQGALLFRRTANKSEKILKTPTKPAKKLKIPILERYQLGKSFNDDENERAKKPEIPLSELYDSGESSSDGEDAIELKNDNEDSKFQMTWKCNMCDILFNSFKEYSDHRLTMDHENQRVTCPICKKTYARRYYKRHMSLHQQDSAHMCDICGKKFIVQSQFTRHRAIHFYDLPFQCELCPYRGRFTESLKMHMRSHTGEKPYQCDQCPSRFISKSNLNKHMQTHKTERDFHCEVCGKGFYVKRELELHIKVDHTGIRDHNCKFCGKAFGYRKQMMKHELRVHKREKFKSGRMPIYLKVESMKKQNAEIATES